MAGQSSRRGRPKGSGLDDRKQLETISRLISQNPELKPTTAIRSLGITNPSTIRRLRDKYNAFQKSAIQDLKSKPAAAETVAPARRSQGEKRLQVQRNKDRPAATRGPEARPAGEIAAASTGAPGLKERESPAQDANLQGAVAAQGPDPMAEPARWIGMMCELGIRGMSAAMAINTTACQTLATMPQVRWACRNQLAFNQMWLSMIQRATHPASATVH